MNDREVNRLIEQATDEDKILLRELRGHYRRLEDDCALAAIVRHRLALSSPGQGTEERGADRLAVEVARLIERHVIDSRSPVADALLDYKDGKFYGPTKPAAAPEPREAKVVALEGGAP